ncbi:hypothetical protein M9Y10_045232 [Tritrichomonas musculus]|uniref:Uncharacterized protein n=1 Tax=Tritrichomonas musculus TaxID=1915356 RepID=A0ABR2JXM7_9EUKA
MDPEVVIHKSEQINSLICGKQQRIGSSTNRSQNNQTDIINNDFSKYPFPEPIEPSRTNQQLQSEQSSLQPSRLSQSGLYEYNKLRQDESLLNKVSNYLHVYDINSKRKAMILHQEIKERYLQPLADKLSQKTSGANYKKFLSKKDQAISSFDKQANSQDTYYQKLPQIPLLTFHSDDLVDPILKYRKNNEDEKKLIETIQKSTGKWNPPASFPERDIMNLEKFKILSETRFYAGDSDSLVAKGKKISQKKYDSEITTELDNFAPPVQKKPYIPSKNAIECQMDHIKFGE